MAICMFCKRKLTKPDGSGRNKRSDKAVEHVLKRQWLNALGHHETILAYGIEAKDVVVSTRSPRALSFVTGEVCYHCNSGWMQKVDAQASASLLALARGDVKPELLSRRSRRHLARWLLKTACVLRYVAPKHMRHIPRYILDHAHEPTFLPRGFLAFTMRHETEFDHALGASSIDKWLTYPDELVKLTAMPQRNRLKCAFQYDKLVIGCCWVATPNRPRLKLTPNVHEVLYKSRARYRYLSKEEDDAIDFQNVVRLCHNRLVNIAQMLIGVEFPQRGCQLSG